MTPVRMLTYNVRYFSHPVRGLFSTVRGRERIAAALATTAPHIICLQEVEAVSLRARSRVPQIDELARALPSYSPHYFAAHRAGAGELPIYSTGLAMLVDRERFEVRGEASLALTPAQPATGGERRIAAQLTLCDRASKEVFHVFTTHLALPSSLLTTPMGDADNQVAQAARLLAWIDARAGGEPLVLCGDFNAEPDSRVHRELLGRGRGRGRGRGQLIAMPSAPGPTAGLGPLRMCLDHMFGNHAIEWIDNEGTYGFGDRTSPYHRLSDHLPLIARFRIARALS